MHTLLLAFIATTNALGYVTLTAETNKAVCAANDGGPSTVTRVALSKIDSPANWRDCEYGDKSEAVRYSVRKVIAEMKRLGKFAAFRQLLETANCDWDFIGANYLAADDADFQRMMAAVVAAGILTQAELDALLPRCIWSAE